MDEADDVVGAKPGEGVGQDRVAGLGGKPLALAVAGQQPAGFQAGPAFRVGQAGMAELLADAKTAAARAREVGASGYGPATSGCWPMGTPPTRHHQAGVAGAPAAVRRPTC